MKHILLILSSLLLLQVNVYASNYQNDAGTVNRLVSAISDQLTQNKNFQDIQKSAIAVTSFVCLDNFQATSRLSNILSENLMHEMQVRGYKIIDFKTMENIKIDTKGDFIFSRDIAKLRNSLNLDYVLTGTYVEYKSGLVVNARIIDLKTHIIVSSAQIFIPQRIVKKIATLKAKTPVFEVNTVKLSK